MPNKISAVELFAMTHGKECKGSLECHWCASPCDRQWQHDDPPPVPFARTTSSAKRPSSPYICVGCLIYRRPSVTVQFMGGGFKDRQTLKHHSWWLDENGIVAIRPEDHQELYKKLLSPPSAFSLALLYGTRCENLINLAEANDFKPIQAGTTLKFTINNVLHEYSVYELSEGLKHGLEGKMGGVRALVNLLGPLEMKSEEKRPRGRPANKDDSPRRVITSE